ncbi:tyrosine-type recombinase/integrase [Paraburkholderia tropica]|uniref:tyrosine-type recombinase/integrase n=1 Tax=Paraburkholderia tropica TaxID=92647 RepID=UPI0016202CF6|nr:site-specific integrase [Paraburkholderia tropica]MBB2977657.1 integrase [Paraburkholderia tropica]
MAKRQRHILSDVEIKHLMRAAQPVAKSDGDGLTFTLSAAGTAAWVLRFSHGGRRHELTLGTYPDLKLGAARALAATQRVEIMKGVNPAVEKRKERARKDWSVRQLIKDYRERVLATLAESTQQSYGRNLDRVEHGLGSLPVRAVSAPDIVGEIERTGLGWVEEYTHWCVLKAIFKHAVGKRLIDANPCAGVSLEAIIGKRPEVRKRLMLAADEICVLMNAAMSNENRLSVCVLLATGVRISELTEARREHLFLDEARWHIPESKTGPSMDIPLAPAVVEWFQALEAAALDSAYILPARLQRRHDRLGGDACVSKDALREAIDFWIENHGPGIRRFTPHDLRSTMKSHMRKLGVARDISEMCLNHKLPGVEGIYDQYTYYPERRAALELWAKFLLTCQAGKQWNVTPIREGVGGR